MRVGMHLGPFYASTSLGGRRRPRRSSSGGLIALCIELTVWMLVVSAIACYVVLKAMWLASVWLAGQIAAALQRRREGQAAQVAAERQAAVHAHAQLIASLRPEDVAFLQENGWQSSTATVEPSRP